MKILFNDICQNSNLPVELKSPALSLIYNYAVPLTITLDKKGKINSIGIGNTNATMIDITINNKTFSFINEGSGLYVLPEVFNVQIFSVRLTNASYIGRIAAGFAANIPTAIPKEPIYSSTNESRVTLSGQVIEGLGGFNYRSVYLDSRYKIDSAIMEEIKAGYKFISKNYPFFIDLSVESYKLPFKKLYAIEKNQINMSFEGGVKKYLYSRRWEFEERF